MLTPQLLWDFSIFAFVFVRADRKREKGMKLVTLDLSLSRGDPDT